MLIETNRAQASHDRRCQSQFALKREFRAKKMRDADGSYCEEPTIFDFEMRKGRRENTQIQSPNQDQTRNNFDMRSHSAVVIPS